MNLVLTWTCTTRFIQDMLGLVLCCPYLIICIEQPSSKSSRIYGIRLKLRSDLTANS
jgi:hypothetical protein